MWEAHTHKFSIYEQSLFKSRPQKKRGGSKDSFFSSKMFHTFPDSYYGDISIREVYLQSDTQNKPFYNFKTHSTRTDKRINANSQVAPSKKASRIFFSAYMTEVIVNTARKDLKTLHCCLY